MAGFIGLVATARPPRMCTISAWEAVDDPGQLRSTTHRQAVHRVETQGAPCQCRRAATAQLVAW